MPPLTCTAPPLLRCVPPLRHYAGTSGIAYMAVLGGSDAPANFASGLASSSLAAPAKFAVGFPLTYHFLGAVRHAVWDKTASGFTNAQMLQSSYALIGASTAIALGLSMYSLPPNKDANKK